MKIDVDLGAVNLADPSLYEVGDPDAVWATLRRRAPVFRNGEAFGHPFWAVTRYEDAVSVYGNWSVFTSERGMMLGRDPAEGDPGAGRMLVVTDPPRHAKLRRIVGRPFTPRMMRQLEDSIRSSVVRHLGHALARETCDFVSDVAARIPVSVICELLGVPRDDWEWMHHLTSVAIGSGDPEADRHVTPADRAQAYTDILLYYSDLVAHRRRDPGDDVVSTLVHGAVDGCPLSDEDILLNCTNLIIGGNETTRHAASGGVLAFADRPGEWRRVRDEPERVPTAVEELLRWTTPVMHLMRVAVADTEIGGQRVRAGDAVVIWNASANRDENVFDDPQRFDTARHPNRHLAFGIGEHYCVGAALARLELRVLLEEMRRRVASIERAGPVERVPSIVLRGIKRLPVRLVHA